MATSKCPKCRVGNVFVGNTYGFKKKRFNEVCPHCGFRFEIEPGYFYAAMYVSYALVVMQAVLFGMLTYLLTHSESPWIYLITVMSTILAFAPFNYRYSRLILLHFLSPKVKYDPKYEDMLAEHDDKKADLEQAD